MTGKTTRQQCRECGEVMFDKPGLHSSGQSSGNGASDAELHQDEADLSFKCPKCGARNLVDQAGSNG